MSPHRGGNVISGPNIDKLTERLIEEATAELRQELLDTTNQLKQVRGELGAAQRTNGEERRARKAAENTLESLQRDAAVAKERRIKLVRTNAHYRAQLVNAGITPWKEQP